MKTSALIVLATFLVLLPQAQAADTEKKTFDSTKIKSVEATNGSGDIHIAGTQTKESSVSFEKMKFGKDCETSAQLSGAVLIVKAKNKSSLGSLGNTECQVNISIQSPRNVALKLTSGSGNLKIENTSGAIEYKVGSGDVKVNADVLELNGNAGSGNQSIRGATGNSRLRSGSGDIEVIYSKCPAEGNLDMDTGSGNAFVILPKTATAAISFKAGSGELRSDIQSAETAKFRITMKAGSGNLTIKKQK